MREMDPDFYKEFSSMLGDDDEYDDGQMAEECDTGYYDTYDRIFDDSELCVGDDGVFECHDPALDFDEGLINFEDTAPAQDHHNKITPEIMGIAFSLAAEIKDAERNQYSLDKNTDQKNWEEAMRLTSLQNRRENSSRLRPFEQYVEDVCKGRKSMFKSN